MSLQFYFGPSDEDLCNRVYEDLIRESMEQRNTQFLVLVPDQFTMQTQKQLVQMHPRGGILNIDVLSFGRLQHRVLEELGKELPPTLDDTGKSLLLQKIASSIQEQCPVLGGNLHRQGYIHEIKSAISEFMQYGISVSDVDKLIAFAKGRGALQGKLRDLKTIYEAFAAYIREQFITTEETMDVLSTLIPQSAIVRNSVIVLCGFTGFTPIQYRLIQALMQASKEFRISLCLAQEENPYVMKGEQDLFFLTRKTVEELERMAWDLKVSHNRNQDVFVPLEKEKDALRFLTQNLFTYSKARYEKETDELVLFETMTAKGEIEKCAAFIKELVLEKGYAYRDIAVIAGNLEEIAPFVETEFARIQIPFFLDATKGLRLNPLTELLRSALRLYEKKFSHEAVMHYMRSGLADFTIEEIDAFENYILETGICGISKYTKTFAICPKHTTLEELEQLNDIRSRFMEQVKPLCFGKKEKASVLVETLYQFLVGLRVEEKLHAYKEAFAKELDQTREKEYAQVYRLVMELLDQIYQLLGEEEITPEEFAELLEAGIGEIQVGSIPQQVDRVLVGDMERTRLPKVKVLFFVGMNDGNIPRAVSGGGIISDMDREFLQASSMQLAPTPRQQMYIQRFYLYLNLTKPSHALYLSYSRLNNAGKSMRPAYLIGELKKMYPKLSTRYPEKAPMLEQVVSFADGKGYLAAGLRQYAAGLLDERQEKELFTLYNAFAGQKEREKLEKGAFLTYDGEALSKAVALALYGKELYGSISRLETYAACAMHHFLQYGLSLQERKEFGFESVDMGNVFHAVLEHFSKGLAQDGTDWFHFDRQYAESAVQKQLEQTAAIYGASVLYSTHRNMYAVNRMERILVRTVLTLQQHLLEGDFEPREYEMRFGKDETMESVNLPLGQEEWIRLHGSVDRLDVAKTEDQVMVKIVDYKSSAKEFDANLVYQGLTLQLPVYMNYALERIGKQYPQQEVIPAAMLYYQVFEPFLTTEKELDDDALAEKMKKELRAGGVVNDADDVLYHLDKNMTTDSFVIPVGKKKDGSFNAASRVLSLEEMQLVSSFVTKKITQMGQEILQGTITTNPYKLDKKSACTYCSFKAVCGFDEKIPGCERRKIGKQSKDDSIEKMKEF